MVLLDTDSSPDTVVEMVLAIGWACRVTRARRHRSVFEAGKTPTAMRGRGRGQRGRPPLCRRIVCRRVSVYTLARPCCLWTRSPSSHLQFNSRCLAVQPRDVTDSLRQSSRAPLTQSERLGGTYRPLPRGAFKAIQPSQQPCRRRISGAAFGPPQLGDPMSLTRLLPREQSCHCPRPRLCADMVLELSIAMRGHCIHRSHDVLLC